MRVKRKTSGSCQIEVKEINGRVTMKCKNLKRKPTQQEASTHAQAILDSVKTQKVIFK